MESESSRLISDTCIICHLPEQANDKLRRVTATGLQTIITYSQLFNVIDLERNLLQNAHDQHVDEENNPVQIHVSCQKTIGNEIRKKKRSGSAANVEDVPTASKIRRRSCTPVVFNWKEHCLFCADPCVNDERHPDRKKIGLCQTIQYRGELLEKLKSRSDSFAETLRIRLLSCNDLPAAEARYHTVCRDRQYLVSRHKNYEIHVEFDGYTTSISLQKPLNNSNVKTVVRCQLMLRLLLMEAHVCQ
ncbi:Uncharacterised protein r2_g1644 [Pycnogonum litorale]